MKKLRYTLLFIAVFSFLSLLVAPSHGIAQGQQPATAPTGLPVSAKLEQMVPMRDGVKLATNIFLPQGSGPFPVVLQRTPYGKDSFSQGVAAWNKAGFAYVVQDSRGKGKSEGVYHPFVEDPQDGFDTVEWLAKQSWSTGKIGMYGASAMGIAANLAAMENPPHLTAAFVMVARSSIYHQSAFMGGVFRKELNEIWLKRQGAVDVLLETFKHAVYDGAYDSNEMSKHWQQIHIPMYNYGGWYDIFSEGNIQNFLGLQKNGAKGAAGNQKLILGPWAHGQVEEVKYPANSSVGIFGGKLSTDLAIRWFEYWLKGQQNGIMNEPPVRYYVMGDVTDAKAPGNEWRTAASWPPPAKITSYYLSANGGLATAQPPEANSSDTYQYDPKNPVPTIGGANLNIKKGPMDQRAIGDRKDVLKYQTPVLSAPLEVTGKVSVELFVESDAPDTDFMAKLVDVYPDGTERLVLDSAFRVRFREGFNKEVFMKKGEVYKITIDLWNTSLIFNKGHRLAIHISSSNDPRFDPNPNTGKPLRADSETRVATNTIHHSRAYASRALLPIVPMDNKRPLAAMTR
ncbi:MAG: CocE/NonD family hydrolase [Acidobacteria bacterium]|nr:CocE/NonD family hydrolase [Acidobacteriota bacterium]